MIQVKGREGEDDANEEREGEDDSSDGKRR